MISLPRNAGKAMSETVTRYNDNREQTLKMFHRAIKAFEAKSQWATGSEVDIMIGKLQGREARLYLRNEGGRVSLFLYRKGLSLSENLISVPFIVGVLTGEGWKVSRDATENGYISWHRKVEDKIARQR